MTDNFQLIESLISFDEPNCFYIAHIICRRKDNPHLSKNSEIIKEFSFFSLEEFQKHTDKIKSICIEKNARAYFNLNSRDASKVSLLMMKRLAELVLSKSYKSISNLYSNVVGECHQSNDPTWIIDVDDATKLEEVRSVITKERADSVVAVIPTKNGAHLISRPFNLNKLADKLHGFDIHKNNPTILFCP